VRPWPSCALLLTAAVGLMACGGGCGQRHATPTPRPAPAAPRVEQLPCAADFGTPKREWFRARYPRWSLRIGPVTFLDVRRRGAHAARTPLARRGGAKFPVLLEPNRSVSIAIARESRHRRLRDPHQPLRRSAPAPVPDNAYAAVHLQGCPPIPRGARLAPNIDGTFFATFMAIARDACVPLEVTPDGEATIRRVVSLGAGRRT
jgi:hypothetical protein